MNKNQFSIVAEIARKYGTSEQVFSDVGLIISAKRTNMKEDLFGALIRNGELDRWNV